MMMDRNQRIDFILDEIETYKKSEGVELSERLKKLLNNHFRLCKEEDAKELRGEVQRLKLDGTKCYNPTWGCMDAGSEKFAICVCRLNFWQALGLRKWHSGAPQGKKMALWYTGINKVAQKQFNEVLEVKK